MRRFTLRIVATAAILFGLMLPASAFNPDSYSHPCGSHTHHAAKQLITGTGSLYSEGVQTVSSTPNSKKLVWIVYFRPSIHHSNWTMVAKGSKTCYYSD